MPDSLTIHPWLQQFSTVRRHYVTHCFADASHGAPSPEVVLEVVAQLCVERMERSTSRSTEELCKGVLLALIHQRPGALAYAQTLLDHRPSAAQ